MGIYVNPNNEGFKSALRSRIYVDKSMLIDFTNSILGTEQKYICITRPRRFGKSMAAKMLSAYYSCGCDSKDMFSNLKIAKTPDFESELNKNCVIALDIQRLRFTTSNPYDFPKSLADLFFKTHKLGRYIHLPLGNE